MGIFCLREDRLFSQSVLFWNPRLGYWWASLYPVHSLWIIVLTLLQMNWRSTTTLLTLSLFANEWTTVTSLTTKSFYFCHAFLFVPLLLMLFVTWLIILQNTHTHTLSRAAVPHSPLSKALASLNYLIHLICKPLQLQVRSFLPRTYSLICPPLQITLHVFTLWL